MKYDPFKKTRLMSDHTKMTRNQHIGKSIQEWTK